MSTSNFNSFQSDVHFFASSIEKFIFLATDLFFLLHVCLYVNASDHMTVPRQFQDAILFAVTKTKRCVGIKIFNHPNVSDRNGNLDDNFDDYIDRCVRDAIDLKKSIEEGTQTIENDPRIVKNPDSGQLIDMEKLVEIQSKSEIFAMFFLLCVLDDTRNS